MKMVGIHGICKPESIGARDSDGCIRLYKKLQRLRDLIFRNVCYNKQR